MKRIILYTIVIVLTLGLAGCSLGDGTENAGDSGTMKTFSSSLEEGRQLWYSTENVEEESNFDLFVFENGKVTIYAVGATFSDIKGMSDDEIIEYANGRSSNMIDLSGKSEEEINEIRVEADQYVGATQDYEIVILTGEGGESTEYEYLSYSWLARYPGNIKLAYAATDLSIGDDLYGGYMTKEETYFVQKTDTPGIVYTLDEPSTPGVTVK